MVNIVEKEPLEVVVTSPATEIPLHPTGTVWLIGAGRLTVGSLLSPLHSRTAPADDASKPDPVMETAVPPFRHVPGSAVRLGEPLDVVDFAVHGTVVVVMVGWVVVVVVVVVPPPPLEKLMSRVAWSPAWSPNAMTQESPAVTCAAVGGHGYAAASVAALPPPESVPLVGGPTVPSMMVKLVVGRLPLEVVVTSLLRGLVHETGTALPASWMVGCPGWSLHSRMPPVELAANPAPETVTESPPARPVDGVTVIEPAAPAAAA
jgi:hypothetical protein